MPRAGGDARIYTVVDVWRGIAVGAHTYRRLKDAKACAARLREGRNLFDDDVRLFEGILDADPRRDLVSGVKER